MIPPSTYVEFLLVFLGPALVLLAAIAGLAGSAHRRNVYPSAVAVVVLLALAYTIPWDNYLIARGVWWYGDGTVTHTIWNAPLEEYAFIVLQPLVTALWLRLLALGDLGDAPSVETLAIGGRRRAAGIVGGLVVGAVGLALLTVQTGFYLGAILAWAAPVLAIQWAFGWPQLLRRGRTVLLAVAVPTAYFCAADLVAIRLGIWELSPLHTTGVTLAGLPIEEALFFLVTNVFVVQGLVLYAWLVERWHTLAADGTDRPAGIAADWSLAFVRFVERL